MFERVIAQTIQKITAETLQERSLIPLVDILQDPRIPARIKPFFETEVHWWLYNDHLARAANKRFDYDHPEVTSLLNYLEQVQFRHARFEREEFISVLDSAVKLTYNYLCRPQTTLKWYIFRGQPVKPLNEVMLRFGTFVDYEYFQTVFIEWVERKRAERPTFDAISATEFERVIRRTDDQILLNCTVEDLLEMMGPLFEFIGEGEEQKVPVDALVIFFDDKNIKKLVDQLENYRDRGGIEVGREEFVSLLDELLSTADDEPETDFSSVYQNDELDDVVRMHLQGGQKGVGGAPQDLEHSAPGHFAPEPSAEPAPRRMTHQDAPASPAGEPEGYDQELEEEWPLDPEEGIEIDGEDHHGVVLTGALGNPSVEEDDQDDGLKEIFGEDDGDDAPEWEPELASSAGRSSADAPATAPGAVNAGDDIDDDFKLMGEDPPEPATPADDVPLTLSPSTEYQALFEDDADEPLEPVEPEPPANGFHADMKSEGTEGRIETEPAKQQIGSEVPPSEPIAPPPHIDGAALTETLPTVESQSRPLPASAPQAPSMMSDVRRFIDPSLERKVVKKIFAKNRADYEAALDRLNEASSWRIASQVLDELFIRYGVDPYSRTAIRFTDSVYGRYLP